MQDKNQMEKHFEKVYGFPAMRRGNRFFFENRRDLDKVISFAREQLLSGKWVTSKNYMVSHDKSERYMKKIGREKFVQTVNNMLSIQYKPIVLENKSVGDKPVIIFQDYYNLLYMKIGFDNRWRLIIDLHEMDSAMIK